MIVESIMDGKELKIKYEIMHFICIQLIFSNILYEQNPYVN